MTATPRTTEVEKDALDRLTAWRNIPIDTHNCHLAITACGELYDEIERLRTKLKREGSSCGCHWSYADEKDLDGTQDQECAYHADEKRTLQAEIERLRCPAPRTTEVDIVTQLRREADSCADVCCILRTANVMRTAADEIERLRRPAPAADGRVEMREALAFINKAAGTALGIAYSGRNHPNPDEVLLALSREGAALSSKLTALASDTATRDGK